MRPLTSLRGVERYEYGSRSPTSKRKNCSNSSTEFGLNPRKSIAPFVRSFCTMKSRLLLVHSVRLRASTAGSSTRGKLTSARGKLSLIREADESAIALRFAVPGLIDGG